MRRIGKVLLAILLVLLVLTGATFGFLTIRQRQTVTQVEQARQPIRFGSPLAYNTEGQ